MVILRAQGGVVRYTNYGAEFKYYWSPVFIMSPFNVSNYSDPEPVEIQTERVCLF